MIFDVLTHFTLSAKDGRTVYVVRLDRETTDFAHLLGQEVLLETPLGRAKVKVAGVERFTHAPPWRKGESIGILPAAEPVWRDL